MKRIFILTLILGTTLFAQEKSVQLSITVTNITSSEGVISIGLFNSDESLGKYEQRIDGKNIVVTGSEINVEFTVPTGEYAIGVFHDTNSNGSLDKNGIGIPEEPYAFSNNRYKSFGRPDYELSKFIVSDSTHKTLELR